MRLCGVVASYVAQAGAPIDAEIDAKVSLMISIRSHLKIKILVQYRGGIEFLTGGILLYFEDLK